MAEAAKVETAASAINVFLMASPFSLNRDSDKAVCPGEGSTFRLNDQ
jgi:hypothetical protein